MKALSAFFWSFKMGNEDKGYTHDVIVIGGGPGGYVLALECARRGMKTALIDDREALGGTCLNVGCIPSKALLESSELYYRMKNEAGIHGIVLGKDNLNLDVKSMMKRKSAVVTKLTGGIASLMKARKVEVIQGRGTVTGPNLVRVEPTGELKAQRVVLATGSLPSELTHLPFDGKRILDSTDALSLTKVPESLAVIGAGAVGLELGSVWSRLGAQVTVIEAMKQIIPGADAAAARTLASTLKKQGVGILTGAVVESARVSSRKISLSIRKSGKKQGLKEQGELENLDVEKVLVAVGRRANIDSALGMGVNPERTADGRFLKVDDKYATSVPGLFAIGDLVGNPMLAHKAEEEALALAALFAGEAHPPWGGPVPGIVYTEPELAWAGESEESLKASGTAYIKGQFSYGANARALAAEAGEGFVKLLSSPGDEKLLGAVILGRGASELIAETVSVMAMGGCAQDIALTIHGHPTLSEITKEAAMALSGRPLHRA